MTKIAINDIVREMTAEEQAAYDARQQAYIDDGPNRKLTQIKQIRLEKLQETDWWVLRGTMTDAQKDFRQNLRDIPANHTDEAAYDLLLARDDSGNLTHSVWSKP